MTGSAALIADSMHSGADVVASGVTMISVKMSSRPADEAHPYGYGNIQFISSAIVGLILILGALYLIYESIVKIATGTVLAPSGVALLGAVLSVATNELMYRYQSCVGRENNSPAIIANAWDNRSDALSSLGVLVGIAVAVAGFPVADNLAAICVGVLVAKIGIGLNVDAVRGLMDSSVELDVLRSVYDVANTTPNVVGVHYLRGRNVGEDLHLEVDVYVDGGMKVYESDVIAEAVRKRVATKVAHVSEVLVSVTPVETGRRASRVNRRRVMAAAQHV
jgi:cation diffusion facilitator family transporter